MFETACGVSICAIRAFSAALSGTANWLSSRSRLRALATEFGQVDAVSARVSRLPLYLPWLTQLAPPLTFDMRAALALHADGIARGDTT